MGARVSSGGRGAVRAGRGDLAGRGSRGGLVVMLCGPDGDGDDLGLGLNDGFW